ncbi:MAG TPA: hypothetical protein PLG99_01450, partial [Kaistiaceae bacterium]|nr:hypothetical protein [Kaistiaceae bacterium]
HDIEVEDEARAVRASGAQEVADTVGHGGSPNSVRRCRCDDASFAGLPYGRGAANGKATSIRSEDRCSMRRRHLTQNVCPTFRCVDAIVWNGEPIRTPGKEVVPLQ